MMIPIVLIALSLLLLFSDQVDSFRMVRTFNKYINPVTALKAVVECSQGAFDETVLHSDEPVVVDFYADWCGPCKLAGIVFKQIEEDYTSSKKKVKFVKVDTDVNEDVVDRFTIQGLPLFGVFANGEMVASHSGALTKDKLREFIEKAFQSSKISL